MTSFGVYLIPEEYHRCAWTYMKQSYVANSYRLLWQQQQQQKAKSIQ